MSPGIVRHIVAGILFVGVGTARAQEVSPKPAIVKAKDAMPSTGLSSPQTDSPAPETDSLEPAVAFRLHCVAGIEEPVGVTVPISLDMQILAPNETVDGRHGSAKSSKSQSDSPTSNPRTGPRWLAGAMARVAELVVRGVVEASTSK